MEVKNRKILEALQMQPLSEEEMTARHILGRMYGPIASCVESTRNTRLYNRELWEKALQDEIFLEKVAAKSLFLELGHPADREETDMKQTCACIPEVPKIVGDDLCAYVDILDTPNGRLLKTLVDYGFVPGISSRGSGDVLDNNQVDPETFFLETWDIVQLPAVKKARLNICESLDSDGLKLKKALAESYKAAKEEDKDTMKKALENLNIELDEFSDTELVTDEIDHDDIPWDPEADDTLVEEMPADETDEEPAEGEMPDETETPADETAETEEVEAEEEPAEAEESAIDEHSEEVAIDVNTEGEADLDTVGDAIELLQEYDDDIRVELEPIEIDGKEYPLEGFTSFVDDEGEEPILVLGVSCKEAEEPTEAEENIEQETEEPAVETIEEVNDDEELADDNGDEEVIESLKEMVRQKEALEAEVADLRKAKSVGDAKEHELQEKLLRYQAAFKTANAEAARVPELDAKVKELTEQLTQAQNNIKELAEKASKAQQLKESIEGNKANERRLNEEVSRLTKQSKALEAKLANQNKVFTEKFNERTALAKSYKARFMETLAKYVNSKASMLGVPASEITSRLNENYTLADVDVVCDEILDSTVNFSRLPFGGRAKTSARITESVAKQNVTNPEFGYEVDDALLELAGLKK